MRKSILDLEANLEFNKRRWGDYAAWHDRDRMGYEWAGGVAQLPSKVAWFADKYLRPHTSRRYDLKILELSPGAGRFTLELIRYASCLDLLDMNQACLDICRERFTDWPTPMRFFLNDGRSCAAIEDHDYDLIACFDSMVHMHPNIIYDYVSQLGVRLKSGGVLWLDHSGKGPREAGHRTDITPERMAEFARASSLEVVDQRFRNDHDCVSVLRKPVKDSA